MRPHPTRRVPAPAGAPGRLLRQGVTASLFAAFATLVTGEVGTAPPSRAAVPSKSADAKRAVPSVDVNRLSNVLAEFNRGAALMEQYKYSEAVTAFEKVLEAAPDWTAARFNLGLAYFNMHGMRGGQTHLETARRLLESVLATDADHLHARFCLGLYYQHLGETEKALAQFRAVHEGDPRDAHVAYKYAEALISVDRREEGMRVLEKVIALDPGFISGVYKLALLYQRERRFADAKPLFERFKALNTAELTGGAFTVQKTYGTAGKYYQVLGADNLPLPHAETAPAPRILFSPEIKHLDARARAWTWTGGSTDMPGIAAGDLDGDGDLDLCLTGLGERGSTSMWFNDGAGRFSGGPSIVGLGICPCLGDVDNDGDLDLWLGRAGADVLYENDGKGQFRRGAFPDFTGFFSPTPCARVLDVDSDGDLDLVAFRLARGSIPATDAARATTSSVYNNNRDGSFADIAARLGLAFADAPIAAVVYDDFDNDRDLDLVAFPAGGGEAIAWVNDRVWQYHVLDSTATGLDVRGVVSATSGDPDKDGDRDLLVFTSTGIRLYINRGPFRFQLHQGFADRCARIGGTGGQFADMDNDGDTDIVIADGHRSDGSRGPVLLINDWPRDRFLNALEVDPGNLFTAIRTEGNASCVVADFTGNGRCDVFLAPAGARPFLVENVTRGGHWIALDFLGTRERDKKTRSNRSAIGTRVDVKTGRVSQQYVVGVPSGPVAMPPLRIHAGLGDGAKVEWLRMLWPDAVLQAELELAADQVTTVTELPRKTSSCPLLFAWDGSRFEFVADFGGVGGLGYFVAPGVYAAPDPTEFLRIPHLEPLDGEYVLQILEPLEEVVYFDEAKLIAVDHPAGTEVYPREMMAISAPPPPFEVFCFKQSIDPVRAVDHRGTDVTGHLRRIDRRYAGATDPDPRFVGVAGDHHIDLDFGRRLATFALRGRFVLFLYGWVEYPYSSTNFAMGQAGMSAKAPSIFVRRDGRWIEVAREVGYPAGLQHMMTLDVTGKILPNDRWIRISSNMEIYWDRIFAAAPLADAAVSWREVAVGSADLHFFGYPREYSPDGHHPTLYDYSNVDRTAGWKLMPGEYTRYGDVAEVLEAADDCYVIMAAGDELTLRFPVGAFGPVPQGRSRTFILKTDSYCKDMDLYTAHPDGIEPLPFHAMSGYPYRADERYPDTEKTRSYRRRFNTRRIGMR